MDNGLLVTHTHSLGQEDPTCHVGLHGSYTQKQSEQPGPVRGRLHGIKRVRCTLASVGGCDWLV